MHFRQVLTALVLATAAFLTTQRVQSDDLYSFPLIVDLTDPISSVSPPKSETCLGVSLSRNSIEKALNDAAKKVEGLTLWELNDFKRFTRRPRQYPHRYKNGAQIPFPACTGHANLYEHPVFPPSAAPIHHAGIVSVENLAAMEMGFALVISLKKEQRITIGRRELKRMAEGSHLKQREDKKAEVKLRNRASEMLASTGNPSTVLKIRTEQKAASTANMSCESEAPPRPVSLD
ncbi:MAG: hypothetical protein M1814_001144 [Vezdaea aestivalis]|nr:MAG: hypothetical protein M1814_001144 [Vezdaea aestivalis]